MFGHRVGHGEVTRPQTQRGYTAFIHTKKISRVIGTSGIHVGTMSVGKMEGDSSDKGIAYMLQDDAADGPYYREEWEGMNENIGHSKVILTAGGGAFGHKDGPKQGATSCRQGEESWKLWKFRRSNSSAFEKFQSRQSGSCRWEDCDLDDWDFDEFNAMEPPSANVNVDEDGVPTRDEEDNIVMPASEPTGPYHEEKHNAGECKPCLYVSSKAGCRNGEACNFCHLPHRKQVKNRPSKATRKHCKKIVEMLETHVADLDARLEFSKFLGARTAYTKHLLKGKNRAEQEEGALVKEREPAAAPENEVELPTDAVGALAFRG